MNEYESTDARSLDLFNASRVVPAGPAREKEHTMSLSEMPAAIAAHNARAFAEETARIDYLRKILGKMEARTMAYTPSAYGRVLDAIAASQSVLPFNY